MGWRDVNSPHQYSLVIVQALVSTSALVAMVTVAAGTLLCE